MASDGAGIRTRILIISDTHGDHYPEDFLPEYPVDVAIHCGDLTEESKLDEFKSSLKLLERIKAPLKLVIAGNHDFTLDAPTFKAILKDANPPLDQALVKKEFGDFGESRKLLTQAKDVTFLDEGTYSFVLENGARVKVYASPYTPSKSNWGFQYRPEQDHDWPIERDIDIAITHGPPHGVLDRTDGRQRAGSPSLFKAIAEARPRLHCFGHIHEGWGAKLVTWRDTGEDPTHFNAIDNDKSTPVESLLTLRTGKFDGPDEVRAKAERLSQYRQQKACTTSYCKEHISPKQGNQTLFVNAAIQGEHEGQFHLPWVVDIELPEASRT